MTCAVCGGKQRFSVLRGDEIPIPLPPPGTMYLLDRDYMAQAISHCRAHPEHDTGEPFLSALNALRARLTPEQWKRDSPSPWPGGLRHGETE